MTAPLDTGLRIPSPRVAAWRHALTALLVAVFVATLAVLAMRARLDAPYKGFDDEEIYVDIPAGTSEIGIAQRLVEAGVVVDVWTFRLAVWRIGAARTLKAGEYRFTGEASARQVAARLARGDVVLHTVTFPEGLALREMALVFEARGLGRAADFLAAAREVGLVADLDAAAPDLEGYLFPDTYAVPRRAGAADLVRLMVQRFRAVFDPLWREQGAATGRTVREVVTLASLVEKETARDEERATVAGVYANRLRLGMRLQCDPTVIHALVLAGRWDGNIRRADLAIDSPYNTYRYAGLPPGPIASPGRASLAAALAPADVPYLYFVSRNDGSHVFSTTLDEHNRHVQQFQVQYFRERRQRARDGASPSPGPR